MSHVIYIPPEKDGFCVYMDLGQDVLAEYMGQTGHNPGSPEFKSFADNVDGVRSALSAVAGVICKRDNLSGIDIGLTLSSKEGSGGTILYVDPEKNITLRYHNSELTPPMTGSYYSGMNGIPDLPSTLNHVASKLVEIGEQFPALKVQKGQDSYSDLLAVFEVS